MQVGERVAVLAAERAAQRLARGVDRVGIDVLADLARDVGFGRQGQRQRGESRIDASGAGVFDQRAEGGDQGGVAFGRAAGADGLHPAQKHAGRRGSAAPASG